MQTRVSFNSGEFSPDMACRSDLDQFGRGCSVLENWDVAQTGGVKRRRGMRHFARALGAESRLMPYIYSYADGDGYRFLIEAARQTLRVFSTDGEVVAQFDSSADLAFNFDLETLHWKQINRLLIITCSSQAPMVLEYSDGNWAFRKWAFKHQPWRYNEIRDFPIDVVRIDTVGGQDFFAVTFPDDAPEAEKMNPAFASDYLRASVYMEQRDSGYSASRVLAGVQAVSALPSSSSVGAKYAVLGELRYKSYICIQEFQHASNYVEGFDSPENYPQFFKAVEDDSSFGSAKAYRSLAEVDIAKDAKVRFVVQYWEYWTCVKKFSGTAVADLSFADFPDNFVRGVEASAALPCASAWAFYCSGLWYGEYAVKRNFESAAHSDARWETEGLSRSYYGDAANMQVSGNELNEECYVKLYLTRSFALSASSPAAGFPSDSCQNRLIVSAYRHDEVFHVTWYGSVPRIVSMNNIRASFAHSRSVENWSWAAFADRYGYPILAEVFQSRLVFASTLAQPQTLWLSRSDDLDNFRLWNVDDAAMALTLNTTSQNPICWIMAQSNRIMLGTGEREFAIGGGSSSLVTYRNAQASDHSRVGSAPVDALPVIDKVLYVERGSGRVYEYTYSLEVDGYISRDLTVFASHILNEHGGAVHSTLVRKPDTVAVFTLGDGQLALCTYNAHQEVKAWHRWVTDGTILDVCGLPDGRNADRLFLLVSREDSVAIEVVDALSPFVDNGGRAYDSTLITNSLAGYSESPVGKRPAVPFAVCFGAPVDLVELSVELTVTGGKSAEEWKLVNDNFAALSAGWHDKLIGKAEWSFDRRVGFRVRGDAGFEILALQG